MRMTAKSVTNVTNTVFEMNQLKAHLFNTVRPNYQRTLEPKLDNFTISVSPYSFCPLLENMNWVTLRLVSLVY